MFFKIELKIIFCNEYLNSSARNIKNKKKVKFLKKYIKNLDEFKLDENLVKLLSYQTKT